MLTIFLFINIQIILVLFIVFLVFLPIFIIFQIFIPILIVFQIFLPILITFQIFLILSYIFFLRIFLTLFLHQFNNGQTFIIRITLSAVQSAELLFYKVYLFQDFCSQIVYFTFQVTEIHSGLALRIIHFYNSECYKKYLCVIINFIKESYYVEIMRLW